MTRINKDANAYRATHHEGLDKQLNDMNTRLEAIQKSLDMYLETKKVIFPRFYFISNDDLLEILGQSKNPQAVQPHFKKLFDNIKSLKLQKASMGGKIEALSMSSTEGEEVPFAGSLVLEGPVEAWLCDVESTMRVTLKDSLRNCKASLKKNLNKRDKWLKEWPGQLCITASQMQWTADCTRALQQVKARQDKKPLKSLKKKQVFHLKIINW
jgi:dynein heavy chain